MYKPSPPFSACDTAVIPGLIFLHGCEIKSGSGLETRLQHTIHILLHSTFRFTGQTAWVEICGTNYEDFDNMKFSCSFEMLQ